MAKYLPIDYKMDEEKRILKIRAGKIFSIFGAFARTK